MDPLDGRDVYAAEKILKSRVKKGKTEYLIKWKGWPNSYNTWEPLSNILNESLFSESGFPVPSGFKERETRRSLRVKKRFREASGDSEQTEEARSVSVTASENASETGHGKVRRVEEQSTPDQEKAKPKESNATVPTMKTRPGTSKTSGIESNVTDALKRKGGRPRKGGKKKIAAKRSSALKDIKEEPVTEESIVKEQIKGTDERAVEQESQTDKEEGKNVAGEKSNEVEIEKAVNSGDTAEKKDMTVCAPEKPSEECAVVDKTKILEGDQTASLVNLPAVVEETELLGSVSTEEVLAPVPVAVGRAEVYTGRTETAQVVLSGQKKAVNRLAFVISNNADEAHNTQEMQIHDYGGSDESQIRIIADQLKNETKMWSDANNSRRDTFQYNGSYTLTEVTHSGQSVPIVEL